MGQIITTQNLVAIKEVRHAGQRMFNSKGSHIVIIRLSGYEQIIKHYNCMDLLPWQPPGKFEMIKFRQFFEVS